MSSRFPHTADTSDAAAEPVLSVAALTEQIKSVVEGSFSGVWVTGEISNFSRPQSGHCYFTLKDESAQIRAVVWRATASRLRVELGDGQEVICYGDLEVYAPRGTYQLVVRKLEPKGIGALELALRKLRDKLAAEGLFDPQRKRPLPRFPRRLAFVTSPTGAAIRDFLEVLRRRWRGVDVLVVPVRVQGDGAAEEIAAGIAQVNRLAEPIDILVVGRGGGSLEDLWAFNEEPVVRAIAASRIPVISAVGHEIDVTLADLVADVRALTPSEAAELCVPATDELTRSLQTLGQRATSALRGRLVWSAARLAQLEQRRSLRRPLERVHDLSRRSDELGQRLHRLARRHLSGSSQLVASAAAQLEALSPLGVLARGYSITQQAASGTVVRDAKQLNVGEQLITRLAAGTVVSRVEEIE